MFHPSRLPPGLAAITEGNVIPTHRGWTPALEAAAKQYAEANGCDVKTMSPARQRLMLSLGAIQEQHARESRLSIGRDGLQFGGGPSVVAKENTTPADIDNFTTQQIAYVRDLAEAWVIPEIATTVPLTGPTGYIHRESATRANSDSAYEAGTALLDGVDPSYSDCPSACGTANGVNLSITPELVEYVCKRLSATYCYPANFQVSTQYGFSLDARLLELMREKLQRDVQTEVIDDMVANAGEIILWDATPAGGSYYASANPQEWQATLYNQIVEADSRIVADPQGRVGGATQILADLLTVTRLRKLVPFRIRGDYATAQTLNNPAIDEMQANFGIANFGMYPVVRVPTMADNTMLVQRKDDRDPTYVYCPWIVLQSLGMLLDPAAASVKMGMMHLYAKKAVRSGRMVEIRITPET